MHYRGHNIVTASSKAQNITSDIKPRMVITYLDEDGFWIALAHNEQGYIVEGRSEDQTLAVDTAIDKSHSKLTHFLGYKVEKISDENQIKGVIYWDIDRENLGRRSKYIAQITLSLLGKETTIHGHGMVLENALEHIALKLRGITPDMYEK